MQFFLENVFFQLQELSSPDPSRRIGVVHSRDTEILTPKLPETIRISAFCLDDNRGRPEERFDAIFYLHAFPSGITKEELLKTLAAFLKPGGLLYLDMTHGVWKAMVDPVARLLELFGVRTPKDAQQIFMDFAQTHSMQQHEAFQAAQETLQKSPLRFTQLYLTDDDIRMNYQEIIDGWPASGFFFERWLDPSVWETPPVQEPSLLADWKRLTPPDRIALIEQTVSPRLQAWFRYRPESRRDTTPQQKPVLKFPVPEPPETKIQDDTSERVASLYNVNPYPSVRQFNVFEDNIHYVNLLTGRCFKDPLPENLRILVAGCGTIQGAVTARSFPGAQVLAIDISDQSLAIARQLARDLHVTNIEFRKVDLNQLEKMEGFFDLIISTGVLHHLKSPHKALQNLVQRLSPGGVMHLMVYNTELRRHAQSAQHLTLRFPWPEHEKVDRAMLLFRELSGKNGFFQPYARQALELGQIDRAAFADTFLHPQEVSFTIPELYDWLDQAALQPSGFIRPYEWTLNDLVSSREVLEKFRRMPEKNRHEAVNLLTPPWMEFFAERKGRPKVHTLVEENPEILLQTIPRKRSVRLFEYVQEGRKLQSTDLQPSFQNEPGQEDSVRFYFGYPHIFTVAHRIAKDFYDLIDGEKSIQTIAEIAGGKYGLGFNQVKPFALDMFRRFLFRQQMVLLNPAA